MKKIKTLNLPPYNHTFGVFDSGLDVREAFHDFNKQTMSQGFSRNPGSYNFYTLTECKNLLIEIQLADLQDEIVVSHDTVRAIMVPYSISKSGIVVSDLLGVVEELIQLPEGKYALVFEIRVQNNEVLLSSLQTQNNNELDFLENQCCILSFYPRTALVESEILRFDSWKSPPDTDTYWPLNPTYPLLMNSGLP
jgi:hypothetical protein